MNKILFIAVFSPTSTNNSQSRGFINAGWNVLEYNYRKRAEEIGSLKRDQEIIKLCKMEKPNLILFAKCNGIDINVIKNCNKYTSTVLWYPDPLDGNWNSELIEKIKYSEFTLVTKLPVYKRALKYSDGVYLIDEGFDHLVDRPFNIIQDIDIGFIGGLKEHRQKYYDKLKFNVFNNVYGEEHAKTVGRCKINLNFITNKCINDRVYKILAAKGFLLTEDWEGRQFQHKKHLVIFNSVDDLRSKIDYYLEHEDERKYIAEQGYKEVQQYNRDEFAKKIIKIYESLSSR